MSSQCDTVLSGVIAVLALVYLAFQVRNKRWSAIVAFFVISVMMCCGLKMNVLSCTSWRVCIMVAIIGSNVVALPQTTRSHGVHESFANLENVKSHTDTIAVKTNESGAGVNVDNQETVDTEDDNASIASEDTEEDTDEGTVAEKGNSVNNTVDTFSTFMETYKSLTPDQIENMTTDTKDLIKTQKALMKTVKNLAPVISQGKEMMDTFKDYFGPSGTSDLMKAFKDSKLA